MNNIRVADRLGGFIIGLPTVALPIWIAGWSPWLGVITTTLFLVVAVFSVCGEVKDLGYWSFGVVVLSEVGLSAS